jgi:DNA-binding CsgD family transcriptional regulator/PAS domain-containing protein
MPRAAALPDLIAALYGAAARNDWPPALTMLGDVLGGAFTLIGIVDKATGKTASLTSRPFTPGNKELYRERYFQINPRSSRAARSAPGDVFTDADLADRRALDRHPYYAEFLAPSELGYFAAGNLQNGPARRVNLSVQRTLKAGHASREDADLLHDVLPHAASAFELWERLQAASAAARLTHEALEAMPAGALIVDGAGHAVYANAAGAGALDEHGPLTGSERLTARDARSARGFERALDAALDIDHAPQAQRLSLPGGDGRTWSVSVKPLPNIEAVGGAVWRGALILVEPQLPLAKAEDLQRQLGLTAAEAALAIALADGRSAKQYATEAHISINTVRTHLASLREKLIAKNQAQIVARVLRTLG